MGGFKTFPWLLIKPLHPKEVEIHPRLRRPNHQKTYFCDHIHVKNYFIIWASAERFIYLLESTFKLLFAKDCLEIFMMIHHLLAVSFK